MILIIFDDFWVDLFQTSSGNGCDQKKITLPAGKPVKMMMMMMMMVMMMMMMMMIDDEDDDDDDDDFFDKGREQLGDRA